MYDVSVPIPNAHELGPGQGGMGSDLPPAAAAAEGAADAADDEKAKAEKALEDGQTAGGAKACQKAKDDPTLTASTLSECQYRCTRILDGDKKSPHVRKL